MLNKLNLPEVIEGKLATAKRRSHSFDADTAIEIDKNRSFLRKYLFWIDSNKTIEDAKNATKSFINKWEDGSNFAYMIFDKNDKLVGSIDAQNIDYENHSAEFGYWLSENQMGHGYVSDIIKSLETLLFDLGMIRLVICCEVENLPSNNVAIKNGYKFEGTFEKAIYSYGTFKDKNVYAKISTKIQDKENY